MQCGAGLVPGFEGKRRLVQVRRGDEATDDGEEAQRRGADPMRDQPAAKLPRARDPAARGLTDGGDLDGKASHSLRSRSDDCTRYVNRADSGAF